MNHVTKMANDEFDSHRGDTVGRLYAHTYREIHRHSLSHTHTRTNETTAKCTLTPHTHETSTKTTTTEIIIFVAECITAARTAAALDTVAHILPS